METSPGDTKHFFFDRLLLSNVKNLLQSQIDAQKVQLEGLDIQDVAKMICTATAGVPRLVTWAIDYLKLCNAEKKVIPNDYQGMLESLYKYINTTERGQAELCAYRHIPNEAQEMYIQMVFDSVPEIPYNENDRATSEVFKLDGVPILEIIWQLGLFTGKRPQSDLLGETQSLPSPQIDSNGESAFIIVPPLVAMALSKERLANTVLFDFIVKELISNQAFQASAEWLETISKRCLQYRLGSGPRKIACNKQIHTLLPFLEESKLPNVTLTFEEIYCLPKFVASRNSKKTDEQIAKLLQTVLSATEKQRFDKKHLDGTTLQPEIPISAWKEVIQQIKPGLYSPAKLSCSGDFYIVIDDPATANAFIMVVFQYKSGSKTIYNINHIATEAYKCYDMEVLNQEKPATKFVSYILLVLVGGHYDLKETDYENQTYALKITTTDMKNAKDTKKPLFSELNWKRPHNFEILVLNDAGLKHLLSPYNLQAAEVQFGLK